MSVINPDEALQLLNKRRSDWQKEHTVDSDAWLEQYFNPLADNVYGWYGLYLDFRDLSIKSRLEIIQKIENAGYKVYKPTYVSDYVMVKPLSGLDKLWRKLCKSMRKFCKN